MSATAHLSDPFVWLIVKLFGAMTFLVMSFGVYEHRRIDKCMTKEQCKTNRDYLEDVLNKFHEGQAEIRKVVTEGQVETRRVVAEGLKGVHGRVDKVLLIASQRRKGDEHDETTGKS